MTNAVKGYAEEAYFQRSELIDMIINMIQGDSAAVRNSDDDEIASIRNYLHRFPSDNLNKIVTALSRKRGQASIPLVRLITREGPVSDVNEYLYFHETLKDVFTPRVVMLIKGLHCTPQLPTHADYSLAPQLVRDQCEALLIATEYLFTMNPNGPLVPHNSNEYHIVDEALVELIMDRHSELEAILAAFDEGRLSADSVRGYLDNPASALATGTL